MILNGNNVNLDLTGGGSSQQLSYSDGKFTLNPRAGSAGPQGTIAEFNAADYDYEENEWNRFDIVFNRTAGNVTMKLYVNGARVYFNQTTTYAYGEFVDGNYKFAASPGGPRNNHGHRFTPIPEGDTELYLSTVPDPIA